MKLLEIDNDLVQHMHLENDILFPRSIAMEKELLERKE
jgi:regulator of cell morphogenesis and NO signaling